MTKYDPYNLEVCNMRAIKACNHIVADIKYLFSSAKHNIISFKNLDIRNFFASPVIHRPWHLTWCVKKTATKLQHVIELGIGDGYSARILTKVLNDIEIFGFDSFKGLPDNWIKGPCNIFKKGSFKRQTPPIFPPNFKIIKGFFTESIPRWLKEKQGDIRLMHIDCDLYASAKQVLTLTNERIKEGTIIIFDELFSWYSPEKYENWQEGEWKALFEWMKEFDREIIVLCRDDWEAVAIKVIK